MKRSVTTSFCGHVPSDRRVLQLHASPGPPLIGLITFITYMLATSTLLRSPPKPSWQTDELEEEWIEPSSSHDQDDYNILTAHSLSVISNGRFDDISPQDPMLSRPLSPTPPGTFLIREDQVAAPILPKPLHGDKSKGLLKDFFSPLALETMFEPPSPQLNQNNLPRACHPLQLDNVAHPADEMLLQGVEMYSADIKDEGLGGDDMLEETHPMSNVKPENDVHNDREGSVGEDVILASDIPNLMSFDGRKPSSTYKFTFSAARPNVPRTAPERMPNSSPIPVKSTPLSKLQAPPTDPRLRLFQFHYDTFTRDHLSAVVDSIAVHTSSSESKSPDNNFPHGMSRKSTPEAPEGYLRATKRLKLTPPEDLSYDPSPRASKLRKDYVGESKNLMRMIKQSRTPSMMTTLSAKENMQPTNVEDQSTIADRPRRLPLGDRKSTFFWLNCPVWFLAMI